MKSVFQALAFVVVFALVSCQSPVMKAPETNSPSTATEVGALQLSVTESGAKNLSVAKARTIFPTNASVSSFKLSGTGPASAILAETTATNGTFSIPNLVVGEWNLTVSGFDATGIAVAAGSTKVTIEKNKSAGATITLVPVAGQGTVNLTVTWPAGRTVTQVVGALTTIAGVSTPVTLAVTGTQATATVPNVASGYYLLVINILNAGANVTSPRYDGVLVYNAKQTTGTYALVEADFDYTPVASVSLDRPTALVGLGGTTTLVASILPETATLPVVSWSSSNTDVATVDGLGEVTGVALGEAVITATSLDGGKTATSTVTVKPVVTGLNKSSTGLLIGGTEQMAVFTSPVNASNPGVVWSTENAGVATVSGTGLVTAVAAGTTLIKATAADGDSYASVVVNVSATAIPVVGVTITPTIFTVFPGQMAQLTNSTSPSDATNQNVTWGSTDETIATVNATGLVTAVAPGKATITVTSVEGSFTATSTVYVSTANWLVADRSLWSSTHNTASSTFSKVSTDAVGNAYAVGTAISAFDFGSGISWEYQYYDYKNLVIKFSPSGSPLWGKMIDADDATIYSSTTDAGGNTYLLGSWLSDYASADYTGGVVWGRGTAFLLKFSPEGAVLWAQPLIRATGITLSDLAVDGSGNLYIAGSINGTLPYQFVGGFNVIGTASGTNALVVKTNASGLVQWAKTTTQGTTNSAYSGVAVDAQGNVVTTGWFGTGTYPVVGTYGLGNTITATGVGFGTVKYTSTGSVAWAALTTGSNIYNSSGAQQAKVAVDSMGSVYTVHSSTYCNFSGLTYGAFGVGGSTYSSSSILAKYSSSGVVEWITTMAGPNYAPPFYGSVAVDSTDSIVVSGTTSTVGSTNLGGVTLEHGTNSLYYAKFDSLGVGLEAEVLNGDLVKAYQASSVAVSGDNIYIAGQRSTINNGMTNTAKALLLQY